MKLATYLSEHAITPADFAGRIGVSPVSVTRYTAGTRVPRPGILARIALETGGKVTPNDFVLTPGRAETAARAS